MREGTTLDSGGQDWRSASGLDAVDRALIVATQSGLPLVREPFHMLGEQLGLSAQAVIRRLAHMQEKGIIRRIGAVPNHYRLGYTANGMTVWVVPEEAIDAAGEEVAALPFVSHCYHRPARPPEWPYTLFAMVHGRSRMEVEEKTARIAAVLGERSQGHALLYSRKILKKTGLRLAHG